MLGITSILQVLFFFSWPNFYGVTSTILIWLIYDQVTLTPKYCFDYPISSFLLFGFAITQYFLPLVFISIVLKPLSFNLELPYLVFTHSLIDLLVLVIAHRIYTSFTRPSANSFKKVLVHTGFFKVLTNNQMWIMGLIGLFAMFYIYFYSPSHGHETTGIVDKLIQGLVPFTYTPFLIPLKIMTGRNVRINKSLIIKLILFIILLFVVSIGRNSRSSFMLGFVGIAFAYLLGLITGVYKTKIFTVRNIVTGLLGIWLITGPITDLGLSMVVVRGQRGTISSTELLKETLTTYSDKDALRTYKMAILSSKDEWNETYLDNIYLSRFCNIKFNDASLIQSEKIGIANQAYRDFSIDRFWATLPSPLLSLFGFNFSKVEIGTMSFGDFLYYQADGENALGGFRTGHFSGTGMAAFGWWYLLILGLSIIPVFYVLDAFVLIFKNTKVNMLARNRYRFSLCILISISSIVQFLPTESVIDIISYLLRGWIQMAFLYWLINRIFFYLNFKNQINGKYSIFWRR